MKVSGDYLADGYARVEQLVSAEIATAFLATLRRDLGEGPIALSAARKFPNLLSRPAFEIYGPHYPPMTFFLWGLTPAVSQLVGRELVPTYNYLRIYREGDVCRVHHDRPSCEHSISLTLDYSDGVPWPIEVERQRSEPSPRVEQDFGAQDFASIGLGVGDALLYQGVHHRHGRTSGNPNAWSAHLFLHWVDADGPYRDHAFDRQERPARVNFAFA